MNKVALIPNCARILGPKIRAYAFQDELVKELKPLRGYARAFHRDRARADDLVQETVLKAWEHRDSFRPGTNMRAWLFVILRNSYVSELRRSSRKVQDPDGAAAARLTEPAAQDGRMAMRDFRSALARLSDEQREALLLVGGWGFSHQEAAELCRCVPATIKTRVHRARRNLGRMLGLGEAVDLA